MTSVLDQMDDWLISILQVLAIGSFSVLLVYGEFLAPS